MGSNRAGALAKVRKKRRRREEARLARKHAAKEQARVAVGDTKGTAAPVQQKSNP